MNKTTPVRILPFAAFMFALLVAVKLSGAYPQTKAERMASSHGFEYWVSDTGLTQTLDLEKIPGYRVQVYQGSSRVRAKEIRDLMVQQYSKLGVYLGFRQPDFRVRVGDFRDKAEAQAYLLMLKGEYPSAFVVPDKVLKYPKVSEESSPTLNEDGFED